MLCIEEKSHEKNEMEAAGGICAGSVPSGGETLRYPYTPTKYSEEKQENP